MNLGQISLGHMSSNRISFFVHIFVFILRLEINKLIASTIGAIAKLDKIQFVSGLPDDT